MHLLHTELLIPIDTYQIECDEVKLIEHNLYSSTPHYINMPLRHIDRAWACTELWGYYRTQEHLW